MILQALHYGAKLRGEELHLQELGIATLTACFVNSNRDPKKGEAAKPSDFWYFSPQENKPRLDPVACDTFFNLVASERMPSWAVSLSPVEEMRSCRANGPIPKTRAWVKRGVLLIAPQINDGQVRVPLAIVDGIKGAIAVIDVDTGATHQVQIWNDNEEAFWVADAEFELIRSFTQ